MSGEWADSSPLLFDARRAADDGEDDWDTVGDRDDVRVEVEESVEAASLSDTEGGGDADLDDSDEVERDGETPFGPPSDSPPSCRGALSDGCNNRMRGEPRSAALIVAERRVRGGDEGA